MHWGKSYDMEAVRYQGTPPMITALANGELEIVNLAYSTLGIAMANAGISDLRVISDEFRDGVPGYFSNQFFVRKDSGIKKIEDLKGKVLATNLIGTGVDIAMKTGLKRRTGCSTSATTPSSRPRSRPDQAACPRPHGRSGPRGGDESTLGPGGLGNPRGQPKAASPIINLRSVWFHYVKAPIPRGPRGEKRPADAIGAAGCGGVTRPPTEAALMTPRDFFVLLLPLDEIDKLVGHRH
jgi:hypothetical protein